ncbi:MAG: hypothetical protein COW65_14560 [Cytophagales bacterium CG18_big_fil_WC_8_21_14_2_50_42_9]|nr:MAG: hypothetical protein COW65_14560 [Cytophagales bacterium CG18_big_fil_WC_8_21_14_2_50_42_9]
MNKIIIKWLREKVSQTLNSIAFFPAVTALSFLLVSWLMLEFDYSDTGKELKSQLSWLHLKDASTARSIISTVAAGIISLTVFSFSMVMIVLNQAASQLSNRILDKLIGNRFQQAVLGFYIGTIVYALFLLSTIRDIDEGIYIPAISTYLLILLTIFDIFLFIYFLHYITQSVKYDTIIARVYDQTKKSLKHSCLYEVEPEKVNVLPTGLQVMAPTSNIFQGFDEKSLLKLCEQENLVISFLHPTETFILKDAPLCCISNRQTIPKELLEKLQVAVNMHIGEDITTNYFYGFRQLTEVAVKALSPGLNDPGTAIISLHALADLLAYRSQHFPEQNIKDASGTVRIIIKTRSFAEVFTDCLLPIWDYGKEDRLVQQAMHQVLGQLQKISSAPVLHRLSQSVQEAISGKPI